RGGRCPSPAPRGVWLRRESGKRGCANPSTWNDWGRHDGSAKMTYPISKELSASEPDGDKVGGGHTHPVASTIFTSNGEQKRLSPSIMARRKTSFWKAGNVGYS